MKIMSFNTQHCLNYIERKIDFPLMARVIRESGAEIVGLNEMRGQGDVAEYTDQTGQLANLGDFKYCYFAKAIDVGGKNAPYGNSILSKYEFEDVRTILVPDPEIKAENKYYETRCL